MTTLSDMDISASYGLDAAGPRTHLASLSERFSVRASWATIAQLGVIGLAAFLYLYNLVASGLANEYYSMAAQAASQSWSAWFWGSLDAGNFITLDKPPLATMLMGLSVRVLGLSSWAILLPEAICGIATVALLFVAVRRYFGPAAATIAGVVAALTPAALLMFRYDNPDALLTLLLVGAGYAFMRGLEHARLRWILLSALLVGLAFNTKYLQAYLVLPAFALTYLVAAPVGVARRIGHLLLAFTTVLVSSLWWVAAVELTPISARPFIGGSTTNSALELLLGYDGLQRIFGFLGFDGRFTSGQPGTPGPGVSFSGEPGILRLFNAEFGGQIAWLIPIALVGLVAGLVLRGHAPRTDLRRAAYLMWGGWLVVTGLVFSFMAGIVHSYYAVVLAPAIGALVGAGAVELWSLRNAGGTRGWVASGLLAASVAGSALLAAVLLGRTPEFYPWLIPAVVIAGATGAALLLFPTRLAVAGAAISMAVLLAGPAAYALDTINSAYSGGDPSAGPALSNFIGRFPIGQPDGGRGPVGPGNGYSQELLSYLVSHHSNETWLVAVSSSGEAAPLQLASGVPVMSIGGFNGGDNALSVEQLQKYIESGQLRYLIVGGQRFGGAGNDYSDLSTWVRDHGTLVLDVGGGTLYDLRPAG